MGRIEERLGRKEQGIAAFQLARDGFRTLSADFPATTYRLELAHSLDSLGALLADLGKRTEAEEQFRQALATREKLAADFPAAPASRQEVGSSHHNLGRLLNEMRKGSQAVEQYRQALAIFEKLAADFPAVSKYRRELATSQNNLARLLDDLGRLAEAEELHRRALAIRESLAADFPTVPNDRKDLAQSHNNLGLLLAHQGKRREAVEQYQQALAVYEKLVFDFPAVPDYRTELGANYCNWGHLTRDAGRASESLNWYDKAIATLAPIHHTEPREVVAKEYLRNSHWGRAVVYDVLAKHAEAVKDWDRAIELCPTDQQSALRRPGRFEASGRTGRGGRGRGDRIDEVVERECRRVVQLRVLLFNRHRQGLRQEAGVRRPGHGVVAQGCAGRVQGRRPHEKGHGPRPAARAGGLQEADRRVGEAGGARVQALTEEEFRHPQARRSGQSARVASR